MELILFKNEMLFLILLKCGFHFSAKRYDRRVFRWIHRNHRVSGWWESVL